MCIIYSFRNINVNILMYLFFPSLFFKMGPCCKHVKKIIVFVHISDCFLRINSWKCTYWINVYRNVRDSF